MPRNTTGFRNPPRALIQDVSYTAVLGQNEQTLPELLDTRYAESKVNYLTDGNGISSSRPGAELVAEKAGITGYKAGDYWYDDIFLVGYGTTVASIDESTGTLTEIKTNFTSNVTDIVSFGNYAFVATGTNGETLYWIKKQLSYDSQTANFTVGALLTGGTSGATARILEDTDAGATGDLILGDITGVFEDGETITDDNGTPGSATADGTLTFVAVNNANAVSGEHLFIRSAYGGGNAGARLFVGGADKDPNKTVYTKTDTGANPPFALSADWTKGTAPDDPNEILGKSAVTTVTSRGSTFIVGYFDRRYSFPISSRDSAGVVVQDTPSPIEFLDHGMARGAIDTSYGTFYMAPNIGLMQMTSVSKEKNISAALGTGYFNDVNMDNVTIVHDPTYNLILAAYGKDSTSNNEVLAYNLETGGIAIFQGWNINRFVRGFSYNTQGDLEQRTFGGASFDGKFYKLFEGFTDNGQKISTELVQELKQSRLDKTSILDAFQIQAILLEDEEIEIHIDIEDTTGAWTEDANVWKITGITPSSALESWGTAGYGSAAWGTGSGGASVRPQKYQDDRFNLEYISAKVRIISSSSVPHVLNFYSAKIQEGNFRNLNNITQIS